MVTESNIKLLERYYSGETSEEENEKVNILFADNENNPEFKELIRNNFDKYFENGKDENNNLSHILHQIHHVIHLNENRKKISGIYKVYKWYKLAAAVLFIPLIIAGSLYVSEKFLESKKPVSELATTQTIFAPYGSRINFTLPDGTKGWLNSGSTLEYSLPFTNKRILVANGEVWFDVAKDKLHPFTVKGGNSTVTVLGTKFNFNVYPENGYTEVILEEGSVQFYTPGVAETIRMKPNERLTFANNTINIETTDVAKFVSWKEGKLVFRGDKMTEVARRIEMWYNVEVEIVDKELEAYVFRGTFQDDSLEEVFRYLSMTSPMRYKIIGRKTLEDGTIQKEKVLLFLK